MPLSRRASPCLLAAALASSAFSGAARAGEQRPPEAAPGPGYRDYCPLDESGHRRCDVKIRTDENGQFKFDSSPNGGYAPADIQSAYGLPPDGGGGKIVALYAGNSDYTNAESDLGVYRSQYGLPPCTTANGCFIKIDEHGGTSYPAAGTDEGEQALDMEMASATCPGCKIMLVEGGDLDVALTTVKSMGVSAFSFSILISFGGGEASYCQSAGYNDTSGLLVTGALGDNGYPGARDWVPTMCQSVLAVGGTTLKKSSGGRGWTETVWGGTGSGCSGSIAKPSWQTDTGCSMRMEGDVAAVADPGTGVSFYFTQGGGGWGVVGGTSASSPIVSGSFTALGVASGSFSPSWVWQNTGKFFDITSGSNGTCSGSPSYFCNAGAGYDGPTGWGSPNGALLLGGGGNDAGMGTVDGGGGPVDAGQGAGTCTTPGGSYSMSCTSCSAGGDGSGGCLLTCQSCTKIDGTQNPGPTLGLPCTGIIVNDDGALACQGGTTPDAGTAGGQDAGSGPVTGGMDASLPPIVVADAGGFVGGGVDAGFGGNGANPVAAGAMVGPTGCGCVAGGVRGGAASSVIGASLAVAWAGRRRRRRRPQP